MNRKQRRAAQKAPDKAAPTPAAAFIKRAHDLLREGRVLEAAESFRQALHADPANPDTVLNLGNTFLRLGKPEEAAALFREALRLRPNFAEAYCNLGVALTRLGQGEEGIANLKEATRVKPEMAEAHCNLGNSLMKAGRLTESAAAIREGIRLKPTHAVAYCDLGNVLYCQDLPEEAIDLYRQAIALNPNFAEAYSNLANPLIDLDRCDEAIAALLKSIELKPDYPEAYSNLGNALLVQDRLDEAAQAYQRALQVKPDYPEAYSNLGNVYMRLDKRSEAIAVYRKAIALKPDYVEARFHHGMALLRHGNFREGWAEAEWRLQTKPFLANRVQFPKPVWTDQPIAGKTILLHAEQGFGDTLQFCRYATVLAARGARVVLRVPKALQRLMATVSGVTAVISQRDALPEFDYHLPLMSAPHRVGTELDTIPATVPYIIPDAGLTKIWSKRLAHLPGKKVGLVWSGDPRPHDRAASLIDRRRSLTLKQLASLAAAEVSFISLQKGKPAEQLKTPPAGWTIHDFMEDVTDFTDTAALIANLDLVIAVDTSVAHLAGAVGKPVWILSRFDACWRWLYDREDTPWYPTARLFHQTERGVWGSVIERVAEELQNFAKG
jgi:tetratricopeptide (TPR) repeat protein